MEEKPKKESFKRKLQSKRMFKSKMELFKETLSTLRTRGSEMEYNEEAMEVEKWGRRRWNSDRERARAVEKKKSEVKFRAGGKIKAPRRFWPPNRRGACPEIINNSLLTHHIGYKAQNRRGVCPNFNFFPKFSPICHTTCTTSILRTWDSRASWNF